MSLTPFTSFTVTAYLQNGVSLDPRVGIGLDALLASQIRTMEKIKKGISGHELDGGLHRKDGSINTIPLPLDKCINQTNPHEWHWTATCATPLDFNNNLIANHTPEVYTIIQSRDVKHNEETVPKLPKHVSDKSGRWKGHRLPIPVLPAHKIVWSAYGNINRTKELLTPILSIGYKRNTGIGRITHWEFTPQPELTHLTAGHLNIFNTNQVARPIYPYCLEQLPTININQTYTTRIGIRPPYWHASNQTNALLTTTNG